jgi:hypothetical protein
MQLEIRIVLFRPNEGHTVHYVTDVYLGKERIHCGKAHGNEQAAIGEALDTLQGIKAQLRLK